MKPPRSSARFLSFVCLGGSLLALVCLAVSLPAQESTDTVVTSEFFESRSTDTEMTTIFQGNVVVTGTNLHITCDRIEIISKRLGEKSQVVAKQNLFKSLVATGRVKVVQGDREANCGRAVVLPLEDKITLTENPVVVDHGAKVTYVGDDLELLRTERRVFGKNVKILFPEIKDLGFDKDKPLDLPGKPNAPK